MSKKQPVKVKLKRLDAGQISDQIKRFEGELQRRVVGQQKPIEEIVASFSGLTSGIRNPDRPVVTLLFMGPTGVGKTETVKVLAHALFGSKKAFTRINCQEFASPHQVAKLLGSPPGYVGSDVEPMLSQKNIDKYHREAYEKKMGIFRRGSGSVKRIFPEDSGHYLSIILFDEVEKADPVLWNSILGILDDGHLTLGNNQEVDFTRSIIILTSNVGSTEMARLIEGRIGFASRQDETLHKDIEKEALRAAKAVFPLEFLNRFDAIVVFRTLTRQHLTHILDLYIDDLHQRAVNSDLPFILELTPHVKQFLIEKGTDPQFGARPLRRAFAKWIGNPLSNLLTTGQVKAGDLVRAHILHEKVVFDLVTPQQSGALVIAKHTGR